jgi:sialate O-acetylesterase
MMTKPLILKTMNVKDFIPVVLTLGLLGIFPLQADVKLPAIFGDHMVLQQGIAVPVWGKADAGEKITVTAGDHTGSATADTSGKWRVNLPLFAPNTPALTVTISGKNTIKFKDVLIGDVWVASGQSNMEFAMARYGDFVADAGGYAGGVPNAAKEIDNSADPEMRLFHVVHQTTYEPAEDVVGEWEVCKPESVELFSAVAYYFGKNLRETLHRPIGLIEACYGGTTSQPWTSLSGLQKNPPFQGDLDSLAQIRKANPDVKYIERHTPSVLFNGMIAPLIPYAIKGVIWYQGEDNGGNPLPYRTLFPRLITDWREKWGQGDFPFLWVQIAGWGGNGGPAGNNWPLLREAQAMTLSLPTTGMATAIDIGDTYDIHPIDKASTGARLALVARHVAYGEDVIASGPVYDKMAVEGNAVRVSFTQLGGGLKIGSPPRKPLNEAPTPTTDLLGFVVAGADKKYVQAQAKIDGDTVVVSSPDVPNPVAVRYWWAHSTQANLYSKDSLPALPFRSDDWNDIVSPAFPPAKIDPKAATP